GRTKLAPHCLVDGRKQKALVVCKFLTGVARPAGVHHSHQIVGAKILLDELSGRVLDPLRAPEACMEIVNHHDVDAAIEWMLVSPDVGLNRKRGAERFVEALDRDVDEREGRDRLGLSVFKDLKVFLLQVADKVAIPVRDKSIHLNIVNLHLEGRLLVGRGTRCLPAQNGAERDACSNQERSRALQKRFHAGDYIALPSGFGKTSAWECNRASPPKNTTILNWMNIANVQSALRADEINNWLLYDFHGLNPIATKLVNVGRQSSHLATRRWYYLVPAQ